MALEWLVDGVMDIIKTESPKLILRKSQRKIESHCREVDKQDKLLGKKEEDLMIRLKTISQDSNARHMLKLVATDIYRVRKNRRTLQKSKNNLSNMENRIIAAQSTQVINESFRTTTLAMAQIANDVNPKYSHNMIQHFEKFNEEMSSFTDMIDSTVEDASMADGEMEEETGDNPDSMVEKILAEAGIDLETSMPDVPTSKSSGSTSQSELLDLSIRLNNLRNS